MRKSTCKLAIITLLAIGLCMATNTWAWETRTEDITTDERVYGAALNVSVSMGDAYQSIGYVDVAAGSRTGDITTRVRVYGGAVNVTSGTGDATQGIGGVRIGYPATD